ncbi:MAG: septum formation initiator family protein [Proteobacteria bacterium]|jgi:cell division protein FtsB|nr:septum formation initiator family protein [Pseudomonadota bacterium]MDA0929004.1 septum formation initiator family protein [Pseudomonadota bacterium]
MKILLSTLTLIFLTLQYQLWLGEDSVRSLNMLEDELAAQRAVNENLESRNRLLEIEVVDLKNGLEAVEERARSELGMIGEDETFYLIID